jgi:hypothetical protein
MGFSTYVFFSSIDPIWDPVSYSKIFSNLKSSLPRYSNSKVIQRICGKKFFSPCWSNMRWWFCSSASIHFLKKCPFKSCGWQPDSSTTPLPMRYASMGYTSMGFTSMGHTSTVGFLIFAFYFISRNTKRYESLACFAKISLVSRNKNMRNFVLFRFALQKLMQNFAIISQKFSFVSRKFCFVLKEK